MNIYTPYDWYWIVGRDSARVYSSATGGYVSIDDETYQGWVAKSGVPTQIDTNDNLGAVLAPYQLRPSEPEVLDPYLNALAETLDGRQVLTLLDHENRLRFVEKQQGIPAKPPLTAKEFVKVIAELLR